MWAWKVGSALSTGNTVVLKTAEQTPLSGLYAASLCGRAGIPAGVVNVLSGFGNVAGSALASHMDVDKFAFTGSMAVGRLIMEGVARSNLKKVTLELGGKSPNIVFNDADIDDAVSWISYGIFFNHSKCCCDGSRIYVQSGIYDKLVEAFKARAASNVGHGVPNKCQQQMVRGDIKKVRIIGPLVERSTHSHPQDLSLCDLSDVTALGTEANLC